MADLTIYNKDDKSYTITLKNSTTNKPINITGNSIWFTVKETKTDVDGSASILKKVTSHTDAANGVTTISLSNSDTDLTAGTYYYDIQRLDANSKVSTLTSGKFIIKQGVTAAVA